MSGSHPGSERRGPRICDYQGSTYRRDFWEAADRRYEDAAERLALQALLPPGGQRLLEIGAGFGRLAPLYGGYQQVILLDYAPSMLQEARRRLGERFTYVCADLYRLPLATATVDTVVQVRVLHHVEDVPAALAQVARVLRPGGSLVLEFANKRHLKAILRYLLRRQAASPFDLTPHEFVPLNWNFHPAYVEQQLEAAGLTVRRRQAVSHFRLPALKRLPPGLLARLDLVLGGPLAPLALAPSQFVRAARLTGAANPDESRGLWRCPACGCEPLAATADGVPCPSCGRHWPQKEGLYFFREGA